jgi:hypothetical protein
MNKLKEAELHAQKQRFEKQIEDVKKQAEKDRTFMENEYLKKIA